MQDGRYIRIVVKPESSSATVTRQDLYQKRGWRKWLALLLGKPTGEWRDMGTAKSKERSKNANS